MLTIVLFGVLLTAVTVALHTAGTVLYIRFARARMKNRVAVTSELRLFQMCVVIGVAASALLLLHLVEVFLWATAYYAIPKIDAPSSLEDCIYFSMITFTSLGFGDIVISSSWRLLSGIQAMAGMLVFGWSSALLFAVMTFIAGFGKATGDDSIALER